MVVGFQQAAALMEPEAQAVGDRRGVHAGDRPALLLRARDQEQPIEAAREHHGAGAEQALGRHVHVELAPQQRAGSAARLRPRDGFEGRPRALARADPRPKRRPLPQGPAPQPHGLGQPVHARGRGWWA